MSGVIETTVGAVAALCSTLSFAPQLVKIWRAKASQDVSLPMYVLTVGAFVLWSVYGLMLGSWPLAAANLVSLGLSCAILVLQLRYRRKDGSSAARAPRVRRTPDR